MAHLIKVTFEYSDGTAKYLDMSELEKWMSFNAIVVSEAERRGINPPWQDIKWRTIDGKKCRY